MKNILYMDEVSKIAGGANSFLQLFSSLDRGRFGARLLCPSGPLAERARNLGLPVHAYTFRHQKFRFELAGRQLLTPLPFIWRIIDGLRVARIAREHEIDLIHTNSLNTHYAGWIAARLTGIPIIWHIRIYWPSILYQTPLVHPNRYIFVSHAVLEDALPDGAIRCQIATVIHNGINVKEFARVPGARESVCDEFGFATDSKVVGIVGRLNPWKGHRVFLHAAKLLQDRLDSPTKFLIVGDQIVYDRHDYKCELRRLAHELGISDSVVFTDHRNDIARLMSSMDVIVSASTDDPNPRVVLEAMSVGVPIVGTRSGGVPEMVPDEKYSLLVTPGSAEELAEAVCRLLGDPPLARRLTAASHQRLLKHFTIERHISRIMRQYDSLLHA